MRYLLSSILLVLFVSCASYATKNEYTASTKLAIKNPYFSDTSKDYVYKANIEAFGNSLGGIFIIKKIANNNHRIVFTTEMGNKIFDFSFIENDFKVNYILKKMDKKILINILKNDFHILITEHPYTVKTFSKNQETINQTRVNNKTYYHYFKNKNLSRIARVGYKKEKVAFLFSEINDNLAEHISIIHKNFKLSIHLRAI